MHYLIDGYNLLHAAGLMKPRFGPGGLEKARRALLGILAGSLGENAGHVRIVFDAPSQPSAGRSEAEPIPTQGIHVEFAVSDESADDRIEKLIRLESAPKRLAVVSSDARIRTAAKRRGARPIDSESFWQQILQSRRSTKRPATAASPEKPAGRATRDSEFWLREFSGRIDVADLDELAGPFHDELTEKPADRTTAPRKPTSKRR